jgi:hypothetical protein
MPKPFPRNITDDIDDDTPLWGADEIGKVINRDTRTVFYLLQRGLIPAKKVGALWVSTRRQLRRALEVE